MFEFLVGIDIGSSTICGAIGKRNKFEKFEIVAEYATVNKGVSNGTIVDIVKTTEAIKNCISKLEQMADIVISEVYISIPTNICEIQFNKGMIVLSSEKREVEKLDLEKVVQAANHIFVEEGKEIIGMYPEQYILNGYDNIKDPTGMIGTNLEVNVQFIITKTNLLDEIFKSINALNIKVKSIAPQPLALAKAVLKEEENKNITAIIDIGADLTSIIMFKNGNLHEKFQIPLGGNIITSDIAYCTKLSIIEAENIKIKYGRLDNSPETETIKVTFPNNTSTIIDNNFLNDIIRERVEELLYLIDNKLKEIDYYEKISAIVLVGGGIALFKGILECAFNILKKPISIGFSDYTNSEVPIYASTIGIIKLFGDNIKSENVIGPKKSKVNPNENKLVAKIKKIFTEYF